MSTSSSYEAIVLKTYNVGEADRFCILFTKEVGRISARSNGVRKLHSKLGSSLLPGMLINVQLRHSKVGSMVSQTQLLQAPLEYSVEQFTSMQIATELLLQLLPDEQELPEIYNVVYNLFSITVHSASIVLGALLEILWKLGYTPEANDPTITNACTKQEAEFITNAMNGNWQEATTITPEFTKRLYSWINNIAERESGKKLKSIEMMLV